jgi:hypothetical protein
MKIKQLQDFINHLENTVNEMSDKFLETDTFQERTLTITLEGESISFPIAFDTYEKLNELLQIELDHQ